MLVFSKAKMVERVTENFGAGAITPDVIAIMDDLDGQEVTAQNWQNRVMGEDDMMYAIGKSGKGNYVNIVDCINI